MLASEHGEQRCVLIVDQSDETREVLRTILERRGVEIIEAGEAVRGLRLVDQVCPDLIVLDLETLPTSEGSLRDQYNEHARSHNTPMVLLGTAPRASSGSEESQTLAKPYHYAPLIRTIEHLLRRSTEEPSV